MEQGLQSQFLQNIYIFEWAERTIITLFNSKKAPFSEAGCLLLLAGVFTHLQTMKQASLNVWIPHDHILGILSEFHKSFTSRQMRRPPLWGGLAHCKSEVIEQFTAGGLRWRCWCHCENSCPGRDTPTLDSLVISMAASVFLYVNDSPDASVISWSSECMHRLKECVSYGVARSWFLARFIFSVDGRFASPPSATAILIIRAPWSPSGAPPCRRGVSSSGSAIKEIIPGTGARAVHPCSCPAVAAPIQRFLAVAPGNASRPSGRWVSPARRTPLIVAAKAAAAALAGAGRAGLGSGWRVPVRPLLSYWLKSDDATLCGAIIKGRDHAGRTGGIWDNSRHVLVRRWDLLHVVWRRLGNLLGKNEVQG